jgi:hypothetical protein
MAGWKGVNSVCGIAFSGPAVASDAVWGTARALGAGHKVDFVSESLTPNATFIPNNSLTGTPFRAKGSKGNEFHAGQLVTEIDYEVCHRLLALTLGGAVAPVEQDTGAASNLHELYAINSLLNIYATMVFYQSGLFVRELPSVKFNGFTLEVNSGERARLIFDVIADKEIVDDSGTNTLTTAVDITDPTYSDHATFNHLQFLVNDQDGSELDTADEYYVSSLTLSVTNNLRVDSVTTKNAPYIDEPERNGWMEVTGSFTLSLLDSSGDLDDNLDKTVKKATLTLTSDNAVTGGEGSTFWSLQFLLPSMQIESVANSEIGGPEIVAPTYNFQCSKAGSAPTGFSDVDAVRALVVNSDSNNALS